MITLPFPPSANRYWRTTVKGSRAVTYVADEADHYKATVARQCLVAYVRPLGGPVGIDVVAYFKADRGDLDNCLKVILDSLQGYAYHDDKQVHHITAVRQYDKEDPRVEVSVFPLEETV